MKYFISFFLINFFNIYFLYFKIKYFEITIDLLISYFKYLVNLFVILIDRSFFSHFHQYLFYKHNFKLI